LSRLPLVFIDRVNPRAAQPAAAHSPTASPAGNAIDSHAPVEEWADQRQGQVQSGPDQRRAFITLAQQRMPRRDERQQDGSGYEQPCQDMIQGLSQVDQNIIAADHHRIRLQRTLGVVAATSVGQVETVAVAGTGDVSILDNGRSHRTALVGALVLDRKYFPLDIDEEDLPTVNRDDFFPEIGDRADFCCRGHRTTSMKGLCVGITYPKKAFHVKEFRVVHKFGAGTAGSVFRHFRGLSTLHCRGRDAGRRKYCAQK